MQATSLAVNGLPCVFVGRPTPFGNPFPMEIYGLDLSLQLYRNVVSGVWNPDPLKDSSDKLCNAASKAHHAFLKRIGSNPLEIIRAELRGKNLSCYCRIDHGCHADILLRIAAGDEP
jgi:hypothetical protein